MWNLLFLLRGATLFHFLWRTLDSAFCLFVGEVCRLPFFFFFFFFLGGGGGCCYDATSFHFLLGHCTVLFA